MDILKKIFGNKQPELSKGPAHAVIVHFRYGNTDPQPIFDLEDKLEAAITEANAGEFDGNDIAEDGSDGFLSMYGPDADQLYASVRPVLESVDFMQGATIKIRCGPPEEAVEERIVKIGG